MADSGAAWPEIAAWLGTGAGASVVAFWQGRKKKPEPAGEAQIAGAIVDSRSIKAMSTALTDASDNYHRDAKRIIEATEENTEAMRVMTDTVVNMMAFLRKRDG